MYKLLSTGMRKFYREYAWKASTAKVSPSKIYPLYGRVFNYLNTLPIAVIHVYEVPISTPRSQHEDLAIRYANFQPQRIIVVVMALLTK